MLLLSLCHIQMLQKIAKAETLSNEPTSSRERILQETMNKMRRADPNLGETGPKMPGVWLNRWKLKTKPWSVRISHHEHGVMRLVMAGVALSSHLVRI